MGKEFSIGDKRNIGIIGHGGCGKTSICDAMVYVAGVTDRHCSVDEGNSIFDFDKEEVRRRMTLNTSFCSFEWAKTRLTVADMPGSSNFISETKDSLMAVGSAALVIDGIDGIKVQTEVLFEHARSLGMPVAVFVNRLDKERSSFETVLGQIKNILGVEPVPVFLPIGRETAFSGVVDLLGQNAFGPGGAGSHPAGPVPADIAAAVAAARETLVERLVEADEAVMERYLEGGEVELAELERCLRKGFLEGSLLPVFCGSATRNIGIPRFLDYLAAIAPSPAEEWRRPATDGAGATLDHPAAPDGKFLAFVFRTLSDPFTGRINIFRVIGGSLASDSEFYNQTTRSVEKFGKLFMAEGKKQVQVERVSAGDIAAVAKLKETKTGDTLVTAGEQVRFVFPEPPTPLLSFAVSPKNKGDEDKMGTGFAKILEEDRSIRLRREDETNEFILSGMGPVQLDVMAARLKERSGVEVDLRSPSIPYRETIKKTVKGVVYRHKKQTGGRGQFAEVHFDVSPLESGSGFEFDEALVGMNVPRNFVPAVEKGLNEAIVRGPLAGFKVVDLKVRFYDGKSHDVDSSEMAFKIAARQCFKKAMLDAKPTLLEPVMKVEVVVPDELMGDVMGDLNSRRGRVQGMDSRGRKQIIKAEVPMAEMQGYATTLSSMTGDRGSYLMAFSHYDEVPGQIAERLLKEIGRKEEEEEE